MNGLSEFSFGEFRLMLVTVIMMMMTTDRVVVIGYLFIYLFFKSLKSRVKFYFSERVNEIDVDSAAMRHCLFCYLFSHFLSELCIFLVLCLFICLCIKIEHWN